MATTFFEELDKLFIVKTYYIACHIDELDEVMEFSK